jgi:hypothetical protein
MVGTTLVEIREYIDSLASPTGSYYLVCGRTGDRPVPVAGRRFEGRVVARNAARATEQYRNALRQYDPRLPYYDIVVCQEDDPKRRPAHVRCPPPDDGDWTLSEPVLEGVSSEPDHRRLAEYCHTVAGAVFEALTEAGHESVEAAVMDSYFDLAETVSDPDDLCLRLLESMAAELNAHLDPAAQANVVVRATNRLGPVDAGEDPVASTFARLQRLGLLDGYTRSPGTVDLLDGTRTVEVELSDYGLSPRRGRFPVLPISVDLARRASDWSLSKLRVVDVDGGWRLAFVLERDAEPNGLVSVPIETGERT